MPRPLRNFFRKLYDEGKFIEQTSMQYYDEETQTFLADRYIVGTCPKCGNDRAYGDQCEKCGSTLSPDELIDPHSAVSGSVPVKRETKHWYLPLDQYEGFLREWILEGHKEWKSNVYGQCKSWLDGGLQPRAVSRDLDWGHSRAGGGSRREGALCLVRRTDRLYICYKGPYTRLGDLLEVGGHQDGSFYRQRQYRFPLHRLPVDAQRRTAVISCPKTCRRMSS